MRTQFDQGGGSTGIVTNKMAIARQFGVKQSEVIYFSAGVDLYGYKVIYDKTTQRAYSLPANITAGTTAVSLSVAAVLVHSKGSVDLGALAVTREEFVTVPGSFALGTTINVKNERLEYQGGLYRWDGALPKVVAPGSTPQTTGGVGVDNWIGVGDAALRGQISDPNGATLYPEWQIARWRDEGDIRGWGARTTLADNTTYIQNAINDVSEVIVPEGVWNCTQLAIPSTTRFRGVSESKSILRIKDGTDQIWHGLVSANATSVDARIATDANVDTLVGPYVTDIVISDLTIDCNSANRPKTYTDREQGTGIELHKVQRAVVERVTVKDALQHCFNVRAGTGSYEKGYDYVAKYPSSIVRLIDCKAYNQLYDDGITTHDSEYIWIDRCETWLTRNYENPSMPAVSNGIEVDDGSRYVWVTDCYSNGGFGGFQAKGHDNTPPAHHVWFRECVAENNHQAFIISAVNSPNTAFDSDYATVHHIYLDKCTAKNTYAFSNSAAFAAEAHYIQLYNCRSVVINDFQVIGKTVDMPNTSTNPFKTIFRNRAYNAHVQFNRLNLRSVNDRGIDGQPLITFESNAQNIKFDGLDIDKFIRGSVILTNAPGVNWDIRGVYLAEGSATYPVVDLGGVGGGTLNAEKILGAGFTAGYLLNGTKVNAVTRPEYSNRMLSGESVFQQVVGCIPAANVGTMAGQNIGQDHVVSIDGGATTTRIGRVQTNVSAGNVNDSTCVTRLGIAVREAGSATTITALNILTTSISPAVDNKMQAGSPGLRFTQFCAVNGTINTSDATHKRGLRNPTLAELAAFAMISRLPSVWQWIAKYEVEGDEARLHSGPTVQACIQIMEDHGLTWSDYSCFCYDEWDDEPATYVLQPATYDQDGNLVTDECLVIDTPARTAGSAYSLRKDELLWWCMRALVAQHDNLEERVARLERQ